MQHFAKIAAFVLAVLSVPAIFGIWVTAPTAVTITTIGEIDSSSGLLITGGLVVLALLMILLVCPAASEHDEGDAPGKHSQDSVLGMLVA